MSFVRRSWWFYWCVALAVMPAAHAWNNDGHQIVAQIALERMRPETRSAIERLSGVTAQEALAAAAVWPDSIVSSRPETRPWHYVNIPARADGFDWLRDCPEGACVVGALGTQWARLRDDDLPTATRREALAFVVHLVADLHQPLHAGDGQDRGGNDIVVEVDGQRSNLHRVMDGEFFPWGELAQSGRTSDPAPDEWQGRIEASLRRKDIVDWVEDSHRLAMEAVYAPLPPARADRVRVMGPALLERFWQLARQRVQLAGWRLAQVLDAALGDH